ncbi:MAG: GNAT family N-acetyltransferase [Ignavibacteria bacterium]|nr:GNAT family N-acetyltransferase [Ignavibacteria bacterium]
MSTPFVIEDFREGDGEAFERLNLAWIRRYFAVEPADTDLFADPWNAIIGPGGSIFFARVDGRTVGTCALLKHDNDRWELAKMAVEESMQGFGIGETLGRAVIDRARELGGRIIFLESNDQLLPAIGLYRKLGFRDAERPESGSEYKRANVYMVMDL